MDRKQVAHVAKLSRLALGEDELSQYGEQLNRIFSYIEKLNALDTRQIEPTSHVLPLANVFREDAVRPSLPVEKVLENAPDRDGSFFKVPKIID
ncbi:MAG: Asp-tRNA(Asn)/Glu-tRNA(Gln) amidotransferase subunit GatC [Nitrospiria bacterium]